MEQIDQQPEGIPVDAVAAFETFQQYHGMEMGRMAGEYVRLNTLHQQVLRELAAAQQRITALEQNLGDRGVSNGARPGGARLEDFTAVPSGPPPRKVKDNPQA